MRTKAETDSEEAEQRVRDIRRATRRQYSAEEKIRIVIAGLRGEDSIAELCRKEGINQNLYYRWSKDFLEAGKKRLAGDTAREATGDEVKEIQRRFKGDTNKARLAQQALNKGRPISLDNHNALSGSFRKFARQLAGTADKPGSGAPISFLDRLTGRRSTKREREQNP